MKLRIFSCTAQQYDRETLKVHAKYRPGPDDVYIATMLRAKYNATLARQTVYAMRLDVPMREQLVTVCVGMRVR